MYGGREDEVPSELQLLPLNFKHRPRNWASGYTKGEMGDRNEETVSDFRNKQNGFGRIEEKWLVKRKKENPRARLM